MSLGGPAIYFMENLEYDSTIALVNNSFTTLSSFYSASVLFVKRVFSINYFNEALDPSNVTPLFTEAAYYGGGILIQDNKFSEIANCPCVDSGLIFIFI